jgi:hypothetical protein
MPFLDASDYQMIRNAADALLDEKILPAADIDSPMYLNVAEEYVANRVAGASLSASQTVHAKNAVASYCAALMLPGITGKIAAAWGLKAPGAQPPNWRQRQDALFQNAEHEIDAMNLQSESTTPGVSMTSAAAANVINF